MEDIVALSAVPAKNMVAKRLELPKEKLANSLENLGIPKQQVPYSLEYLDKQLTHMLETIKMQVFLPIEPEHNRKPSGISDDNQIYAIIANAAGGCEDAAEKFKICYQISSTLSKIAVDVHKDPEVSLALDRNI